MKMATKILSVVCVLILCFVLLATNISCQKSPASPEEAITITYDFPEPRIEETGEVPVSEGTLPVDGDYVSVTMEGLPQWSEPGLPVLPVETASVLLPHGLDVERIIVTCGNKVGLPGSYVVGPGQEAVPLSYEGPLKVTPPDLDVYDSPAPFPGKLYSGDTVQNKMGYRILLVNLHPVEYIPERGQLSYYESLTVEVKLGATAATGGEWQRGSNLAQDENVVREMVDNPGTIRSYRVASPSFETLSLLAPSDYEYVIITSQALNATPGPNNFQALRDEKISRDITAIIVTTEWIYANYPGTRPDGGADNQTQIRNFIIDAYNTWGTKYVLLGGDSDGADVGDESGDDIIPHRSFFSRLYSIDIPADMYYACLDGSFDYDADGIYGEGNDGPGGGEVDLFAEVYVGRAPVDSQAEVQNFVGKTLAYQDVDLNDGNLRKVCMVGERISTNTWGGDYKDEIKEGSSAKDYTTVGFEDSLYAPSFYVSTLYDRDYPGNNWPTSEIVGIINDNVHLINHMGHADVGSTMKMVNSHVDGLTNEELYFIGYSQGCYCGSFDNRKPDETYANYDCISEHLTTEPHGAVAFIANSRNGWEQISQPYDREFWDAVLGEHILNIGIANQDAKEDRAWIIGNSLNRYCYYEINLFGDPELTIKLGEGVTYGSHEIDDSAGGDGDGYPELGESISMPVTLRNTSTNMTALNVTSTLAAFSVEVRMFFEGFEGSSPGDWTVGDWNSGSGEDYWGQSAYRAYRGDFSAYCAEVSDVSGQYYDNDMEAFMVKDVDLSTYYSATLSYYYWINSWSAGDRITAGYFDGSWHWLNWYGGNSGGWVSCSLRVPPTATQIGFRFGSDAWQAGEGAYIDDVVLTGHSYATGSYISIGDDCEEYGDILPGDVATSLGTYEFTIDTACPAVQVVTFILDTTASNGGPWIDSFDVSVILTPPEISSVSATQRSDGSGIVDISYDVSDIEQSTVDVALEYWDPAGSWHSCNNTAGDVGPGINTGTGKAATWDARAQLGEVYISGCKARVTADDGTCGTDSDESNTFDLDTAPPTITSKSPTVSAVPVDSSITAAFSESMNASSAESAFSISPTVPGSFSWTDDTMTFDPTTNLAYSTEYTVTIHGTAMDSAGNGLDGNENGIAQGSPADDYTWSFTTVSTPPEISSVSATQRSDGSGIVDISYDVSDIEQSTVDVALEYWDPAGSWHSCNNTAGDVGPGINTGTGKAATWDARAQLGEVYISGCKARVTADDGTCGTDSDESNTFDLDTAPPTITSKSPTVSAVPVDSSITAAFSESMNASSAESAFSISPTVPGSFSWTDDTMTFDPTTNLAYSTEYTVTIHGTAMDSAGNGLDGNENGIAQGSPADDYTWSFATNAPGPGLECFIATAAYGTAMAEHVRILREFRDEYLLANPLGRAFVDLYYRTSPSIADFITEHPSLKPIVRAGLLPAVAMSTVAVNTTPAEKMVIIGLLALVSAALAIWATRRRRRGMDSA
jgi:hypothetical protein